jgi:hypothetical protein
LDIFETPFYIIITNIIVSELELYFLSMKLSSANKLLVRNYSHDQTKPLRAEMVHFDQHRILFTRFLGFIKASSLASLQLNPTYMDANVGWLVGGKY